MVPNQNNNTDRTRSVGGLIPGNTVGHYRLIKKIGAGGMGEVYLAHDHQLDRIVAVKTLSSELSSKPRFRERFVTEARAAAKLSHPNICSIFSIEEVDDLIFFAMEYVDGPTLRDVAKKGFSDLDLFYKIAVQCCEGLQAAHDQNIIHRDIKSSNIMLDKSNRIKIMDFGLAKIIRDESVTHTGGTMGTYQYMSPEQVKGKALDFRSDMFSLGIVFYELLTGQLPFQADNDAAILYAIVNEQPTPLSSHNADLPKELQWILDKALQKDANLRYQSAAQMLADISGPQTARPSVRLAPSVWRASIAVFPFKNLGPDSENEYFSDGVTEDIITKLSKIRSLKVASRSAVFRFKDEKFDPFQVATRLQTSTFLEGSVRRFGDDIRINAQLIKAEDGFTVWSEQFDRKYADILTLQSEVAEKIAEALNLKLTGEEERTIARMHTYNLEAYDYYLKGKFYGKRRDKNSLETAIKLFDRAIKLDSNYSEALAGLSVAYGVYQTYGYDITSQSAEKALRHAEKALQLNPGSSEAHMALGFAYRMRDIKKAIAELKQSTTKDPINVEAHHFLSNCYVFHGLFNSAAACEEKALELDPFQEISEASLGRIYFYLEEREKARARMKKLLEEKAPTQVAHSTMGWMDWCDRNWEGAIAHFEKALLIEPRSFYTLDYLSDCYRRLEMYDKAIELHEKGFQYSREYFIFHARYGQTLISKGDTAEAESCFREATKLLEKEFGGMDSRSSAIYNWNRGWVSALRDDKETAIKYLETAVEKGWGNYSDFEIRPDWDCLQKDERFIELHTRLKNEKLPDDRAEQGRP